MHMGSYGRTPVPQAVVDDRIASYVAANPHFVGAVITSTGRYVSIPEMLINDDSNHWRAQMTSNIFYSRASLSFNVPVVTQAQIHLSPADGMAVPRRLNDSEATVNEGLATEIAQLFVNLNNADNADLRTWVGDHVGQVVPEDVIDPRIKRFSNAFASVMPQKRLKTVRHGVSGYDTMFEGSGRETRLADLSTGEKQVVFRGAFLLRNTHNLPGSIVLIDEPELSLHPDWQNKIVDFYDKIVIETSDAQSQIIFATHSPFAVHGSPKAKHVIMKRDREGQVYVDQTSSYPGVTPSDVAIAAFDLSDYVLSRPGNRMVVVTEGPTDAEILKLAWTARRGGGPMPFNLMPAHGAKGIQNFLGAEVGKMGPLMDALSDQNIDRCLALFDFDHEGYDQWNGMIKPAHAEIEDLNTPCAYRKRRGVPVWAALLPCPQFRPKYAGFDRELKNKSRLTIELLFRDSVVKQYLDEEEIAAAPGATVLVAPVGQTIAIAQAAAAFQPEDFAAFEPILERIEAILALHLSPTLCT
jgi:hypothetical protein